MSPATLPDIYLSFFMFTTDMKPSDPAYRQLVLAHIKALTAQGYSGFEFPIKPTFDHQFEQDLADYLGLRKFLDSEGFAHIKIATNVGATRTYDPSSPFPEQQQQALRYLKSRVDITAALGGEIMMGPIVIPYGGFVKDDFNNPIWSDALQDKLAVRYAAAQPILEALGEYAETQCVKLAIEPITHWETPGPNKLAQLLEFLKGIKSKSVGAVIDSAHETLDGDGPELFAQHVAELARQERLHYIQVSPPDRGALHTSWMPWDGFLQPVLEVYDGPVAIEIFNAIPVFDVGLRLSRRKFWVPGEDAPNQHPSAYDTAQAAITATRNHLRQLPTAQSVNQPATFYQYNVLAAFDNMVYDGDLTVAELKAKGDLGLGSYTQVDGELIMLDGVAYRADDKGVVTVAPDQRKLVFANATHFNALQQFYLAQANSYTELQQAITERLPSLNLFYAFRIHGTFSYMKIGTLIKQEKPYTESMDVLIPKRPTFERKDFKATMVGFYCPAFTGDFAIHGYHLHVISDDKCFAGHVMAFSGEDFKIGIDHLYRYEADLPTSQEYLEGVFQNSLQYDQ